MLGQLAKFGLTLHIAGLLETTGHEGAIDAKATGQIDKRIAFDQSCLILGSCLGRTLLHRQMARIPQPLRMIPGRHLGFGHLATGYLGYRHRYIYLRILLGLQGKQADIIPGMLFDKLKGCL